MRFWGQRLWGLNWRCISDLISFSPVFLQTHICIKHWWCGHMWGGISQKTLLSHFRLLVKLPRKPQLVPGPSTGRPVTAIVFVFTAVAAETLCCLPAWLATPPSWAPSLPWCPTATASSTASGTTGGQDLRGDSPQRQQRKKGLKKKTTHWVFVTQFMLVLDLLDVFVLNSSTHSTSLPPFLPPLSLFLTSGLSSQWRRGNRAITPTPCRCSTASPAPCTRCTTWPPHPSCRTPQEDPS